MNRAGGFFYHLRAVRSAESRWLPFRRAVGQWLDTELHATTLLLVGPSAGYCLEDALFTRFERVIVLEPDPLARWLLARRARRLGLSPFTFVGDDRLVTPLLHGEPSFEALLAAHPGAAVLFANVLGQVRFLLDESAFSKWHLEWTKRILPLLGERPWASFHDRVSGAAPPELEMPFRMERRIEDAALAAAFYSDASGRGPVELLDHLTGGLFPEALPHFYFHWEIEPGAHHLVEGVSFRP